MKNILLSTFVASLLFTSLSTADTNTTKNLSSKEVSVQATKIATQKAQNNKIELVQEALESLKLSAKAIKEIDNKKLDEAKKSIQKALGKLESILASDKTPKLLPIDKQIVVKNLIGTSKDVEAMLTKVKKLLETQKVQEARELLSSLQSEIDTITVSLPLASYPDALKLASKYLLDNQPSKAKEVLAIALSTFEKNEQIVPIPLINSLELISKASDIAKDDKEQALKHLEWAEDELYKAKALGYVSSSSTTYKDVDKLIKNIQKEVKGDNKTEKLFKELIEKIKEFKDKILPTEDRDK